MEAWLDQRESRAGYRAAVGRNVTLPMLLVVVQSVSVVTVRLKVWVRISYVRQEERDTV